MSNTIITVENLGKKYRIQHQGESRRYVALRDVIANKAKGIFSKLKSGKQKAENRNRKMPDRRPRRGHLKGRAAVMEFDGGLDRGAAERAAFSEFWRTKPCGRSP
jgi:hypothetical protein